MQKENQQKTADFFNNFLRKTILFRQNNRPPPTNVVRTAKNLQYSNGRPQTSEPGQRQKSTSLTRKNFPVGKKPHQPGFFIEKAAKNHTATIQFALPQWQKTTPSREKFTGNTAKSPHRRSSFASIPKNSMGQTRNRGEEGKMPFSP